MKKLLGVGLLFAGIVGATAAVLAIKGKNDKKEENAVDVEIEITDTADKAIPSETKIVKDEFDKLCEEGQANKEAEANKPAKKNDKKDA